MTTIELKQEQLKALNQNQPIVVKMNDEELVITKKSDLSKADKLYLDFLKAKEKGEVITSNAKDLIKKVEDELQADI